MPLATRFTKCATGKQVGIMRYTDEHGALLKIRRKNSLLMAKVSVL